jgi:hypothetical protein
VLFLLVDAAALVGDPELPHLLSFDNVEGLSVEQHVAFVERPGQDSVAVLGPGGTHHVSFAPLHQFRRIAAGVAARPGCCFGADVIERALGFSFLARQLGADAIVSPARSASDRATAGCSTFRPSSRSRKHSRSSARTSGSAIGCRSAAGH